MSKVNKYFNPQFGVASLITATERADFYMGYVSLLSQFARKAVNFMENADISSESLRLLTKERNKM